MSGKIKKIGVWLFGAFCFSFLVALIVPLAIEILTSLFLGFRGLIYQHLVFLYPAYIIIGTTFWLRYSRNMPTMKDTSDKEDIIAKIGIYILSIAIYSVSIGIIFFIVISGLNFVLSLFAGDQYNLLNWFYDLSENSRWALLITCGILFQTLAPYDWDKNSQEQ